MNPRTRESGNADFPTLNAAAQPTFEWADENGNHDVPTTFVKLLKHHEGDRVAAFARLNHAHSRVSAETKPIARRGSSANIGNVGNAA